MPYTLVSADTTPNPQARRLTLDPKPGRIVSCRAGTQDQTDDPMGRAILSVPGVTGVLIHTDFVTVSVAPGTKWPPTIKSVQAALGELDDGF